MEVYKNKTATELAENSIHTLNTIQKKANKKPNHNNVGTLQSCFCQTLQRKKKKHFSIRKFYVSTSFVWGSVFYEITENLKRHHNTAVVLGQEPRLCQCGTTQEHL